MGTQKDVIQKIIAKKIEKIEKEIKETPYHKGTEHHIGLLKARLAALKRQLDDRSVKPGKHGGGNNFMVRKSGDASCLFLGAPSVGKSTLLNALAATKSATGNYAFTTRQVIPGMIVYRGAKIQLLDAPGILPEGNLNYGQGRRILAAARAADLLVIISDVNNYQSLIKIKNKIWQAGIRINRQPLPVSIFNRRGKGLEITGELGKFKHNYLQELARTLGMHGKKIVLRAPPSTVDDFLDALAPNRVYLPAIFIVNKIDLLQPNQTNLLRHRLEAEGISPLLVSARRRKGLVSFKKLIWESLNLIKISFTDNRRGYETEIIARRGQSLRDIVQWQSPQVAKGVIIEVSGPGAKFKSQQAGIDYQPREGDNIIIR